MFERWFGSLGPTAVTRQVPYAVWKTKLQPRTASSKEPSVRRSAATSSRSPGSACPSVLKACVLLLLTVLTVPLTLYPFSKSCFTSSVATKPASAVDAVNLHVGQEQGYARFRTHRLLP